MRIKSFLPTQFAVSLLCFSSSLLSSQQSESKTNPINTGDSCAWFGQKVR